MKTSTIFTRGLLLLLLVVGLVGSYFIFFNGGVRERNLVRGFTEYLIHFDTTGTGQSVNTDTTFLHLKQGGTLGIIVLSDQLRPYDQKGKPVEFHDLGSMNRSELAIRAIDMDSIHIEQAGVVTMKMRLAAGSHLRISQEPVGSDPWVRLSVCHNCPGSDGSNSPLVINE